MRSNIFSFYPPYRLYLQFPTIQSLPKAFQNHQKYQETISSTKFLQNFAENVSKSTRKILDDWVECIPVSLFQANMRNYSEEVFFSLSLSLSLFLTKNGFIFLISIRSNPFPQVSQIQSKKNCPNNIKQSLAIFFF